MATDCSCPIVETPSRPFRMISWYTEWEYTPAFMESTGEMRTSPADSGYWKALQANKPHLFHTHLNPGKFQRTLLELQILLSPISLSDYFIPHLLTFPKRWGRLKEEGKLELWLQAGRSSTALKKAVKHDALCVWRILGVCSQRQCINPDVGHRHKARWRCVVLGSRVSNAIISWQRLVRTEWACQEPEQQSSLALFSQL